MTTGPEHPGLAELARQVRDVLGRFEALANKFEATFLTKEFFKLYSDGITRELEHLSQSMVSSTVAEKEHNDQLERRIASLESTLTWVVRLVIAAVIAALLAGIFVTKGKTGGGG